MVAEHRVRMVEAGEALSPAGEELRRLLGEYISVIPD